MVIYPVLIYHLRCPDRIFAQYNSYVLYSIHLVTRTLPLLNLTCYIINHTMFLLEMQMLEDIVIVL